MIQVGGAAGGAGRTTAPCAKGSDVQSRSDVTSEHPRSLTRRCPNLPTTNAALTAYLQGTELGPLGRYFGPGTDPAILRCATPDPLPYAWDFSGGL